MIGLRLCLLLLFLFLSMTRAMVIQASPQVFVRNLDPAGREKAGDEFEDRAIIGMIPNWRARLTNRKIWKELQERRSKFATKTSPRTSRRRTGTDRSHNRKCVERLENQWRGRLVTDCFKGKCVRIVRPVMVTVKVSDCT